MADRRRRDRTRKEPTQEQGPAPASQARAQAVHAAPGDKGTAERLAPGTRIDGRIIKWRNPGQGKGMYVQLGEGNDGPEARIVHPAEKKVRQQVKGDQPVTVIVVGSEMVDGRGRPTEDETQAVGIRHFVVPERYERSYRERREQEEASQQPAGDDQTAESLGRRVAASVAAGAGALAAGQGLERAAAAVMAAGSRDSRGVQADGSRTRVTDEGRGRTDAAGRSEARDQRRDERSRGGEAEGRDRGRERGGEAEAPVQVGESIGRHRLQPASRNPDEGFVSDQDDIGYVVYPKGLDLTGGTEYELVVAHSKPRTRRGSDQVIGTTYFLVAGKDIKDARAKLVEHEGGRQTDRDHSTSRETVTERAAIADGQPLGEAGPLTEARGDRAARGDRFVKLQNGDAVFVIWPKNLPVGSTQQLEVFGAARRLTRTIDSRGRGPRSRPPQEEFRGYQYEAVVVGTRQEYETQRVEEEARASAIRAEQEATARATQEEARRLAREKLEVGAVLTKRHLERDPERPNQFVLRARVGGDTGPARTVRVIWVDGYLTEQDLGRDDFSVEIIGEREETPPGGRVREKVYLALIRNEDKRSAGEKDDVQVYGDRKDEIERIRRNPLSFSSRGTRRFVQQVEITPPPEEVTSEGVVKYVGTLHGRSGDGSDFHISSFWNAEEDPARSPGPDGVVLRPMVVTRHHLEAVSYEAVPAWQVDVMGVYSELQAAVSKWAPVIQLVIGRDEDITAALGSSGLLDRWVQANFGARQAVTNVLHDLQAVQGNIETSRRITHAAIQQTPELVNQVTRHIQELDIAILAVSPFISHEDFPPTGVEQFLSNPEMYGDPQESIQVLLRELIDSGNLSRLRVVSSDLIDELATAMRSPMVKVGHELFADEAHGGRRFTMLRERLNALGVELGTDPVVRVAGFRRTVREAGRSREVIGPILMTRDGLVGEAAAKDVLLSLAPDEQLVDIRMQKGVERPVVLFDTVSRRTERETTLRQLQQLLREAGDHTAEITTLQGSYDRLCQPLQLPEDQFVALVDPSRGMASVEQRTESLDQLRFLSQLRSANLTDCIAYVRGLGLRGFALQSGFSYNEVMDGPNQILRDQAQAALLGRFVDHVRRIDSHDGVRTSVFDDPRMTLAVSASQFFREKSPTAQMEVQIDSVTVVTITLTGDITRDSAAIEANRISLFGQLAESTPGRVDAPDPGPVVDQAEAAERRRNAVGLWDGVRGRLSTEMRVGAAADVEEFVVMNGALYGVAGGNIAEVAFLDPTEDTFIDDQVAHHIEITDCPPPVSTDADIQLEWLRTELTAAFEPPIAPGDRFVFRGISPANVVIGEGVEVTLNTLFSVVGPYTDEALLVSFYYSGAVDRRNGRVAAEVDVLGQRVGHELQVPLPTVVAWLNARAGATPRLERFATLFGGEATPQPPQQEIDGAGLVARLKGRGAQIDPVHKKFFDRSKLERTVHAAAGVPGVSRGEFFRINAAREDEEDQIEYPQSEVETFRRRHPEIEGARRGLLEAVRGIEGNPELLRQFGEQIGDTHAALVGWVSGADAAFQQLFYPDVVKREMGDAGKKIKADDIRVEGADMVRESVAAMPALIRRLQELRDRIRVASFTEASAHAGVVNEGEPERGTLEWFTTRLLPPHVDGVPAERQPKPRRVRGRELLAVLPLPVENVDGVMVARFRWNSSRGHGELRRGAICRLVHFEDGSLTDDDPEKNVIGQVRLGVEGPDGNIVQHMRIDYAQLVRLYHEGAFVASDAPVEDVVAGARTGTAAAGEQAAAGAVEQADAGEPPREYSIDQMLRTRLSVQEIQAIGSAVSEALGIGSGARGFLRRLGNRRIVGLVESRLPVLQALPGRLAPFRDRITAAHAQVSNDGRLRDGRMFNRAMFDQAHSLEADLVSDITTHLDHAVTDLTESLDSAQRVIGEPNTTLALANQEQPFVIRAVERASMVADLYEQALSPDLDEELARILEDRGVSSENLYRNLELREEVQFDGRKYSAGELTCYGYNYHEGRAQLVFENPNWYTQLHLNFEQFAQVLDSGQIARREYEPFTAEWASRLEGDEAEFMRQIRAAGIEPEQLVDGLNNDWGRPITAEIDQGRVRIGYTDSDNKQQNYTRSLRDFLLRVARGTYTERGGTVIPFTRPEPFTTEWSRYLEDHELHQLRTSGDILGVGLEDFGDGLMTLDGKKVSVERIASGESELFVYSYDGIQSRETTSSNPIYSALRNQLVLRDPTRWTPGVRGMVDLVQRIGVKVPENSWDPLVAYTNGFTTSEPTEFHSGKVEINVHSGNVYHLKQESPTVQESVYGEEFLKLVQDNNFRAAA